VKKHNVAFHSRDYAKYHSVTPIIQPDAMARDDVLRGCLKAYLKSAMEGEFYDLRRINFRGQKSAIDWGFDESKVHAKESLPMLDEIQKVFTATGFIRRNRR